jgi:hypothetical protein
MSNYYNSPYKNNSYKIDNVSKQNIAKVLIQFMNLQTKEVREAIAYELCEVKIDRVICNYSKKPAQYYITDGIYYDKLTLSDFLRIVECVQNKLKVKCKGFTDIVQNYKSLPENSNARKENKYKGMINCCIVKGDCSDSRKIQNIFLGIPLGRTSTPKMCVISGGTRKQRRKRSCTRRRR